MKRPLSFLVAATLAAATLVGCEKAVIVPVPGPPVIVQVPVAVPGPAGPAGATGNQGNDGLKGEPGKSGVTVVIPLPEPAPAALLPAPAALPPAPAALPPATTPKS